ncbi:hypothetical protein N9D15_04355 [Flavobacteriaceae bacterium]|jgi:hypothetical protein|nr:hypothetical protein [Flavobacteriaceae bacterium]
MKKIILVTFLSFAFISYSQIAAYHMVYVKAEDQPKFESIEKNYMSKMAQAAVNDGQFSYWALEKLIHPMVPIGGKLNFGLVGNWYQFVIVYPNMKSYLNSGPWWANAGEKLGVPQEMLSYNAEQGGMYVWTIEDSVFGSQPAKFSVYNFGFAEEAQTFLDNQKPYMKNFENQMKKNEKGRAGWVSGHRLSPKNFGEHNVMTWDGFLTLEDAINHLNYKESKKNYVELGMPSGFDLKLVAEKITETTN